MIRAGTLVACALVIALLLVWNLLCLGVMALKLDMNDFGKFYYSARLFLQGQDLYGPSPATWIPVGDGHRHFWNLNPPHFHLIVLPLATLPPPLALAFWMGASLLSLVVCLRLIVQEAGIVLTTLQRRLAVIGLLAFAGTASMLLTGQLALLLMLPVTLAWRAARHGRWTTAGALLGVAMSVKPFLLILLPYFVLRRQLGAVVAALGAAGLAFALGLLVFGVDALMSWWRVLTAADWAWAAMNGSVLGLLTRALVENPSFAPVVVAPELVQPLWQVGATAIAAVTTAVLVLDATEHAVDRAFAVLLLGAQLISPLGWIYYFWLPLGPVTVLAATWWRDRRSNVGRLVLLATGVAWLMWPLPAVTMLQPRSWATLVAGSAYFWGALALWCSLVSSGRLREGIVQLVESDAGDRLEPPVFGLPR